MLSNKQGTRSLIAFLVTWSFLAMMVTGIVLYIVPQGRIAYWTHWSLLGLDKNQWGDLHMMFGGVFILTGIWHLYYNWGPFTKYLGGRVAGHVRPTRELLASVVLSVAVLALSILDLPPASWVFDLNDHFRTSWVTDSTHEPPFGHAEEVSLAALALRQGLDLERGLAALRGAGIRVESEDASVERIARANATTPMAVYGILRASGSLPRVESAPVGDDPAAALEARLAGTGLGRKGLEEVAREAGIDPAEGLERLAAAGIRADAGERLRPVAERAGLRPMDLVTIMAGFGPGGEPAAKAE